MPKRVGYLYEKMLDRDFIRATIIQAARHKHKRKSVMRVLDDIDQYTDRMLDMLKSGNIVLSKPREKQIYDISSGKQRTIQIVPFYPDAVLHWLLVKTMEPVLMRGMCYWSCASIPGRGGKRVHKRLRTALKNDPRGTKYAAELDIKKYYDHISVPMLMDTLRRKIKDAKFLALVERVLRTCERGLAIGYYICQWMANYYLEPLDREIQRMRGVKYMTRYMDNYVLLGPNKRKLHRAREDIERFLRDRLGLRLKETWQIYRTRRRMVAAVGYQFGRERIKLRKRNFLRLTRQSRRIQKKIDLCQTISVRLAQGFLSRSGQLKHCNGLHARQKYVDTIGVKMLKELIKDDCKRRRCAAGRVYS